MHGEAERRSRCCSEAGSGLGVQRQPIRLPRLVIEQGYEMGRPSLLHVACDKRDGTIAAVRVGGAAVLVSSGTIRL